MSNSIPSIPTADELNLYLVANKLKPTCLIDLPNYDALSAIETGRKYSASNEGLKHRFAPPPRFVDCDANGESIDDMPVFRNEDTTLQAGQDRESLARLVQATTTYQKGIALGYPEDVVRQWDYDVGAGIAPGFEYHVALAKAKQSGMDLPTWLAYISFVPVGINLIAGRVPRTSEKLGKTYEAYVRRNNPSLAARVEAEFANQKLPNKWETDGSGYVVSVRYPK